jgi:flavorubredoxin
MKKLFIYYSLSGNGKLVSQYLSKKNIDIREVITSEPLSNNYFLSIMIGGFKALIKYKDKLINFDNDISKYDEIIIGSPIWNSRLSSPINTVLDKINLKNKKITFILYSGSGKSPKATKLLNQKYQDVKIIDIKEPIKNKKELDKLEGI